MQTLTSTDDGTPISARKADDEVGPIDELQPQEQKPLEVGEYGKVNGADAQLTGIHADGTVDYQLVDEGGEVKRNANNEPLYYDRRPASEFVRG